MKASYGAGNIEATMTGRRPGLEVQAEARELYRQSVAEGQPLTGAALGERFDRTDRWGRMQIAAVRAEQPPATDDAGDPGSSVSTNRASEHPVRGATSGGRDNGTHVSGPEKRPAAEAGIGSGNPVTGNRNARPTSGIDTTEAGTGGSESPEAGSNLGTETGTAERDGSAAGRFGTEIGTGTGIAGRPGAFRDRTGTETGRESGPSEYQGSATGRFGTETGTTGGNGDRLGAHAADTRASNRAGTAGLWTGNGNRRSTSGSGTIGTGTETGNPGRGSPEGTGVETGNVNAGVSEIPERSVGPTVAVLAVAVVAAVASYDHQRVLAEMAGEDWRAWLWPLSVDGLIVAASWTMLIRKRRGLKAGAVAWVSFLAGIGVSLAANVAAAEPTMIGRLVAAWPPLALLLAWELLMQTRPSSWPQRHLGEVVSGEGGQS